MGLLDGKVAVVTGAGSGIGRAETRMTQRMPDERRGQAMPPPEAITPVVTFLASDRTAHVLCSMADTATCVGTSGSGAISRKGTLPRRGNP